MAKSQPDPRHCSNQIQGTKQKQNQATEANQDQDTEPNQIISTEQNQLIPAASRAVHPVSRDRLSRTPIGDIACSSQYLVAPCCESASRSTGLELAPARARAGGPISEQSASGSSHPDARPSVQPGRRRTPPPPVVQRLRERPAYFACSRHGRQTAGLRRHRPILFPALPPCLPGPPPRAGLRRLVWLVPHRPWAGA